MSTKQTRLRRDLDNARWLEGEVLDGQWMVRMSIGAERTERSHVEALWRTMRTEAER